MGSIISIGIAVVFHKTFEFFFELNSFHCFVDKLMKTFGLKKEIQRKRFDLFDIHSFDLEKQGITASEREWEVEKPNQSINESVSIIGVNSWGQSLQMNIKWRPQTSNTTAIKVDFSYRDGKGNTYHMIEHNLMPYDKSRREYKAPGIALEILNPFRCLRIKFRGYLSKNGSNELVFVKMRLLWLSTSNVFDFQCDHKKSFIENELKNSRRFEDIKFENRFEQLGQMKGTVQIQSQKEEKLFLWGNKSKKYEESDKSRQIYRLFGYSKKGLVIHIGTVVDQRNRVRYRYGYAFWGRSLIFPIDSLSDVDLTTQSMTKEFTFSLTFGKKTFKVSVEKGLYNGNVMQMKINGFEGRAVFSIEKEDNMFEIENCKNQLYFPFVDRTPDMVLALSDRRAENVLMSGGKGSSLALLNTLKDRSKGQVAFDVPKGVVVTCNAYHLLLEQNSDISRAIDRMKSLVSKPDLLKAECEVVSKTITSAELPQEIKDEIRLKLELLFDKNQLNQKSFAVRSSASGEDSEEMSAAGQMTTYLGVRGLQDIYSSVLKCWSSQFEFVAVEYKRGYGQDINSPMAVVIQEMVDCNSAGVLFTCDPLTGDEKQILITGNYGIGESVVSGMSEPDTIRVELKVTDNSMIGRTVDGIKSIEIGSKAQSIQMDGSGSGTVVKQRADTKSCCVNNENITKLSNIALEIQKFFGSIRDIEWGVKDNQIYILQSRPVTHLDTGFTEYEIKHEIDTGLPSEMEFLTKANIGECLPGCSSTLNLTFPFQNWTTTLARMQFVSEGRPNLDYCPYSEGNLANNGSHKFVKLNNSDFFKFTEESDSDYGKAMVLAIIGHEIDKDIIDQCKHVTEDQSVWVKLRLLWYLMPVMIYPRYFIDKYYETIRKERYVLYDSFESAQDMFEAIKAKVEPLNKGQELHMKAFQVSSLLNITLLKILLKDKNNPNVFTDFALLMSECGELGGQLVSADVPSALRELAQSIEDKKLFRQLSDEKALEYLSNNNTKSGDKFQQFMATHGHRGIMEFDPFFKVWRQDPIPLIQSLKAMVSTDSAIHNTHDKMSVQKMIDSLKTPLSSGQKFLLKHMLLPLAHRAVAMRESTKSSVVYSSDLYRRAFWTLSERMHFEGLIPDADLLFHMTVDEVKHLLETRSPLIIAKAKQRKRLQKQMNAWVYDEIVSGYDFQPRHLMTETEIKLTADGGMKGTPVSMGRLVARVCVAPKLEDAAALQPGDILVTYSTDIGWSPYFPIIGGIVTELGGLVSHGAVIAREYGLPCLVGVNGACRQFKTGDIVLLDCENAIMAKVENKS